MQFLQFFRNNVVANYIGENGGEFQASQENVSENEFDNLTAEELATKIQENGKLDEKDSQELDTLLTKLKEGKDLIIGEIHESLTNHLIDSVTATLDHGYALPTGNEEASYDIFKKLANFLGKKVPENFATIHTVLAENEKNGEVNITKNGENFTVQVDGEKIGSINNLGDFIYSDTFEV